MPNLVFRFPAGRYHATPWGHHVNEGLVEWPPSPWRIVRSLMATGFSKLGWTEAPVAARELLDGLSAVLPEYRLPRAIVSHTRHFMPEDSPNPEQRTKVFDAFAGLDKEARIGVVWPAVLTEQAERLLGDLVPRLSYLGRAESIVEAALVSDCNLPEGEPATAYGANRPGVEPTSLLAPMGSAEYAAWLASAVSPADPKGPRVNPKKPFPYPPDALAALLVDSEFLQKHGWTQAPGSRRVLYYRPALRTAAVRRERRVNQVVQAAAALFALASDTQSGDVLPRMSRSVPLLETLHDALLSKLDSMSCPELSGRDALGAPLKGHRHVHLVPLDLDSDGRVDHVLLHVRSPMRLGTAAQTAIHAVRRLYSKDLRAVLFATVVGMGDLRDFEHAIGAGLRPIWELSSASVWTSSTPFVPARHIKKNRDTLMNQVQAELAWRDLPRARRIESIGRDQVVKEGFQHFIRERKEAERGPPVRHFFALRLELERPVIGPIALGYGSHFGLGLFAPGPDFDPRHRRMHHGATEQVGDVGEVS